LDAVWATSKVHHSLTQTRRLEQALVVEVVEGTGFARRALALFARDQRSERALVAALAEM
jgi:hypothetical protein